MKWTHFIEQIQGLGYEGPDDDLNKVTSWLKANGHNTEQVAGSDGEAYELKKLYEDRPGKLLDCSKAEREAREEDRVQKLVEERLSGFEASLNLPKGKPVNAKVHDVKVGKDRLADDPTGGFKNAGDFYKAVQLAGSGGENMPDTLAMYHKANLSTYGAEGAGVDGGFAVPPEYRSEITERVMGEDSILSRCQQIPLDTNAIALPVDETTPWQTTGGIQTAWEGETGAYAQSKPALKLLELKLRKLTCLVPCTEELLQDASAMGAHITRKAGEKLDFAIGEAIFRGTGAAQPMGFMNHPSLISVAVETAQTADTFTGINALKMYSRMYPPYRRNGVWFVGGNVDPELSRMAILGRTDGGTPTTSWGTGGLYMPPGGMSAGPYGSLLGRPVIPTQHCMELGDAGDVVFACMDQYIAAIKSGGVESSSSIHLWFDQDAIAFKFRMRMDGQPALASTISPRDGTYTQSAFVTLAAR